MKREEHSAHFVPLGIQSIESAPVQVAEVTGQEQLALQFMAGALRDSDEAREIAVGVPTRPFSEMFAIDDAARRI